MKAKTRRRITQAAVSVTVALAGLGITAPAAHAESCSTGWKSTTLASGLGGLENLEADGHGGFYVSGIVSGNLYHIDGSGHAETLLSGLNYPAGLRLAGNSLYFLTGDSPGGAPGTLERYDVRTRTVTRLLDNLPAPNGLLLLPDGDLLFSNLTVPPRGISRYRPSTGAFTPTWAPAVAPNGLALSADRRSVYTENDVTSEVLRIPLDAPDRSTVIGRLPGVIVGADDMASTRDGHLYVAGDIVGSIFRMDTATGAVCSIADGLNAPGPRMPPFGPTSVRIAPDGNGWALYVTSIDGTLRKMTPPTGVDLAP